MTYDWYKIINLATFENYALVSKELSLFLEGRGLYDVLITKGNAVSMTLNGVFLTLKLNGRNPFVIDGMAIYEDAEQNIWVGFEL